MDYPIKTRVLMSKDDMTMFWGDATCFLTDIEISDITPKEEWSPDVINYHAEIQVTFDLEQNICRIYIEPLGEILDPEVDPNEPIPYEVTEYGKLVLEKYALDNPSERVFVPRTIKE